MLTDVQKIILTKFHSAVLIQLFFTKVDVQGDDRITKEEAVRFWGTNFAKVNASAMFNEVDSDGDGAAPWAAWRISSPRLPTPCCSSVLHRCEHVCQLLLLYM